MDVSTLWQQARFLDEDGYLERHYRQAETFERERLNEDVHHGSRGYTFTMWSQRYRRGDWDGGLCPSCDAPIHWSADDHYEGCDWARRR